MHIGVVSDTHIPDRVRDLPAELRTLFSGADMILHAGDICEPAVLDQLRTLAPLVAVRGNRDDRALPFLLEKTVIQAGAWRIGLIHGTCSRLAELSDRLRYVTGDHSFSDQRSHLLHVFADEAVHCIVFGHTHQACNDVRDGVLLFNPGGVARSPGGGPSSVGILDIDDTGIRGRVIALSRPPRSYSLAEQAWRALTGLHVS